MSRFLSKSRGKIDKAENVNDPFTFAVKYSFYSPSFLQKASKRNGNFVVPELNNRIIPLLVVARPPRHGAANNWCGRGHLSSFRRLCVVLQTIHRFTICSKQTLTPYDSDNSVLHIV